MSIRYIEPLSRAVDRAVDICFRPFDLGKWFVLGFACWLARLSRGGGGGSGSIPMPPVSDREAEGAAQIPEWLESIEPEMFFGGAALALLIGCAVIFFFVIVPLLVWLSSRGDFIFLDDVVHDKAEIKKPWNEYKTEGNSLFLWRLAFILAIIVAIFLSAVPFILYVAEYGEDMPSLGLALLLLCPIMLVAFAAAYVDMFLRSFVVPIMYKERVKTNGAWRIFGRLLKERLGWFLLYGIWLLVLWIGVGFAILILILVTCCIFGIILVIPYIGTVALLPIYVALRALSLEFLAQFGDRFKIFPEPEPALAPAAAGPGGAPPPTSAPPPPPAPEPPRDPGPPSGTFEPEI